MMFKQSSSARAQQKKSSTNSTVFHQKRIQQKVLKIREKKVPKSPNHLQPSYFIRFITSGFLIFGALTALFFIMKITNNLDLKNSFTAAIVTQKPEQAVHIVSFRGSEKSVQLIEIPILNETDQTLSSLRLLRQTVEKEPIVNEEVISVLSSQVGFPVDVVVYVESVGELNHKSQLLHIFSPFNKLIHTSASFTQRFQLWKYIFFTDASQIESQSFIEGGGSGLITEIEVLDIVQRYYSDTSIRKLSPTIAVVNNTSQNGLAKRLGQILSSWGFSVIQLGSEQGNYRKESELILEQDLLTSPTLSRLQHIYQNKLSYKSDQNILQKYRSQMVLFVGEDFLTLNKVGELPESDDFKHE